MGNYWWHIPETWSRLDDEPPYQKGTSYFGGVQVVVYAEEAQHLPNVSSNRILGPTNLVTSVVSVYFTVYEHLSCTCYGFPSVVPWRLHARPLLSWWIWGTALLYYILSVNEPIWSVLAHCGCFPLLCDRAVYPHQGWLPTFQISNISY